MARTTWQLSGSRIGETTSLCAKTADDPDERSTSAKTEGKNAKNLVKNGIQTSSFKLRWPLKVRGFLPNHDDRTIRMRLIVALGNQQEPRLPYGVTEWRYDATRHHRRIFRALVCGRQLTNDANHEGVKLSLYRLRMVAYEAFG